ncbi:hypothetical protein L914_10584, partial [Phytophthora nicotianae]
EHVVQVLQHVTDSARTEMASARRTEQNIYISRKRSLDQLVTGKLAKSYDKAQDHSLYRVLVNKRVNFTKNGSIAGGPDKCGCDVSQQIQLRVQGSVKMQFTPDQEDVYDDIWHNIQLKQLEAPAETHGSCYTGCVASVQLEADPIKWTISFSDGQTHDVILDELIADLTMATSRHI